MKGQITLSELNYQIKLLLQENYPEQIWVVAEIGEMKVNRAGHCYLELIEKDNESNEIKARAKATIWSWQYRFISTLFESTTGQPLTAGLKLLVAATIEFHEAYGLSLNIKDIDPTYTMGDLARKRQEIIAKLEEDGIFDMNKSLKIADIPSKIAIISSPTAAGYQDFMKQLHENSRGYKFLTKLFPASMQGADAEPSIIDALGLIYELSDLFDVVVVIRGGGSQIDLSCFDSYNLASNIAQFPLPVLTGIGHEKDESIVDMVANTRLKTPTAVAEFLIQCFDDVFNTIEDAEIKIKTTTMQLLSDSNTRLKSNFNTFKHVASNRIENAKSKLEISLQHLKPLINDKVEKEKHRIDVIHTRIENDVNNIFRQQHSLLNSMNSSLYFQAKLEIQKETHRLLEKKQSIVTSSRKFVASDISKLELMERSVGLLDPSTILKRGFSLTTKDGKVLKSSKSLKDGDLIVTILSDGKVSSTVKK